MLVEVASQLGKDSTHRVGINRRTCHRPDSQPGLGLPGFHPRLELISGEIMPKVWGSLFHLDNENPLVRLGHQDSIFHDVDLNIVITSE